ncbi:monooxygenase [Fonsecaea pedrosoi]|nr:monooxygenase [Fonsecaea pedrosoi]
MSPPLKVIIVGAGLSGLALAQGLEKNGIDYVVVDKESEPRDRNWGVTIAWSHPLLAQLLPDELYNRLSECQPDPGLDTKAAGFESVIIRDGQTGATIVQPPFPGFGKTLTDIELSDNGVIAHFHDGTSESGSVLVGCDGGGSWVRRWMLGDKGTSVVLPYTFLNFPFRYTAEQAVKMDKMMHPIVDVAVHPKSMYIGIFVLDKPDLERPETWVFYILATWAKENKSAPDASTDTNMVDELKKRMDDWADPFKSAVEWIPNGTQAKVVPLRIWGPPDSGWDNRGGRVTLAGDAAHSMTFHRGQGANNAICDSQKFVAAMIKVKNGAATLAEAVDEYDADVISRGRTEVDVSKTQTDAFHDHANFHNSPIMRLGIKPTSQAK